MRNRIKIEIAYNNGCPILINNALIKTDIGFKLNHLFIIQPLLEGKLIGYYEKHEYRNSETMKLYDLW